MKKLHESYLLPFFEKMNVNFKNEWCVLHSYETLPFFSESDVDMAFNGDAKALEKLVLNVAENTGWDICQKIWYNVQSCYYYVLKEKGTNTYLALDFLMDTHGIGRYGFKTSILTENPQIINNLIPIPNHEVAFFYKLVKRIEKKISLDKDKEYLVSHGKLANKEIVNDFYRKHYGEKGKKLLEDYFTSDNKTFTKNDIEFLNQKRKQNISLTNKYIKYPYWEIKRITNRILKPCGIITYVPNWSEQELALFQEKLEEKVSILFRFVKLNKANSRKKNFIGFIGSSIMICPSKKINSQNKIKYYWGNYMEVNSINLNVNEIDKFVEEYYKVIVNILLSRMANKNYLIEQ